MSLKIKSIKRKSAKPVKRSAKKSPKRSAKKSLKRSAKPVKRSHAKKLMHGGMTQIELPHQEVSRHEGDQSHPKKNINMKINGHKYRCSLQKKKHRSRGKKTVTTVREHDRASKSNTHA